MQPIVLVEEEGTLNIQFRSSKISNSQYLQQLVSQGCYNEGKRMDVTCSTHGKDMQNTQKISVRNL